MRLGIDVGKARIGIARCDLHGMLATPVETVARDHAGTSDLERIARIAAEEDAFEAVVGLPINLRGERTASTDDAHEFAKRLAAYIARAGCTVRLVDERLTTVSAQAHLRQVGRATKGSRSIIDQMAAVVLLQHAIDSERAQGIPAGRAIEISGHDQDDSGDGN